ncbi:hypothetical protein H5410_060052 [Solanum commersonii]|uniref:Uncharacterized protein n=1 Tax=Solanum commersonii TaxID=4109 RepID=A0A9J5W5D3_SOLCO|nr:hypothetical protein H5410_060052 [Solanum commersonii]
MTCSLCKKTSHNKVVCARYGRGSTSQPTSQENSSQQNYSQQSSIYADTTALPRTTQTTIRLDLIIHVHFLIILQAIHISLFMLYSLQCEVHHILLSKPHMQLHKHHLQWEVHHILLSEQHMQLYNQVNQVLFVLTQHLCQDLLKIGFKLGLEEDWEEKKLMQEGPHLLLKEIVLLVNCHVYQVTRYHTVFNSGTSSEKILHGPTKLKSASPINIDIDFKPRGLK